jgi:hypothetical protein
MILLFGIGLAVLLTFVVQYWDTIKYLFFTPYIGMVTYKSWGLKGTAEIDKYYVDQIISNYVLPIYRSRIVHIVTTPTTIYADLVAAMGLYNIVAFIGPLTTAELDALETFPALYPKIPFISTASTVARADLSLTTAIRLANPDDASATYFADLIEKETSSGSPASVIIIKDTSTWATKLAVLMASYVTVTSTIASTDTTAITAAVTGSKIVLCLVEDPDTFLASITITGSNYLFLGDPAAYTTLSSASLAVVDANTCYVLTSYHSERFDQLGENLTTKEVHPFVAELALALEIAENSRKALVYRLTTNILTWVRTSYGSTTRNIINSDYDLAPIKVASIRLTKDTTVAKYVHSYTMGLVNGLTIETSHT